jgi:hypothetical protein
MQPFSLSNAPYASVAANARAAIVDCSWSNYSMALLDLAPPIVFLSDFFKEHT